MRINLPVSDIEYPIGDDTLILSTTDTKGRLTYVNQTFIEVSGFTKEELIGKAHNIVHSLIYGKRLRLASRGQAWSRIAARMEISIGFWAMQRH